MDYFTTYTQINRKEGDSVTKNNDSERNTLTVAVVVKKGEELVLTSKPKSTQPKPPFLMVGSGHSTSTQGTSIDLLLEISNMTSNEKLAFFLIKESILYDRKTGQFNYQPTVSINHLTKSQKAKFSNGYRTLNSKGLVKRITRGKYMVNPRALIPSDYAIELTKWNQIN